MQQQVTGLVVDMQEGYLSRLRESTAQDLVTTARDTIMRLYNDGFAIGCVEYIGYGRVHPSIQDVLERGRRIRVEKRRNNAFYGTNLGNKLRVRGISRLLIMGVTTSFCIRETMRGAIDEGFSAVTAYDLIADADATSPNLTGYVFTQSSALEEYCFVPPIRRIPLFIATSKTPRS